MLSSTTRILNMRDPQGRSVQGKLGVFILSPTTGELSDPERADPTGGQTSASLRGGPTKLLRRFAPTEKSGKATANATGRRPSRSHSDRSTPGKQTAGQTRGVVADVWPGGRLRPLFPTPGRSRRNLGPRCWFK